MKTVLIIGVGQFGSHIARRMEELRCEVMAVDENEKHINDILPYVTNARTFSYNSMISHSRTFHYT